MDLKEYISTVNQKYRAGNATEHSYRGALEQLMQTLLPKLRIVNEPKRVKCGAPDYIASRKDGMPVFYIEAKDIGDNDLDGRNPHGHKAQFTRYKHALDYNILAIRSSLHAISKPSTILSSQTIWTSIFTSMASLWIACVLQK